MKKIGIIGGLSPESTMKYYQWLNDGVRARLGHGHSAQILLSSVDFGHFVALKRQGDWQTQSKILCEEAQALVRAGADFIILATNTMHKVADDIERVLEIPFLHIADMTASAILKSGINTVGLLGTAYTMEQDFYKNRLINSGIKVVIPPEDDRKIINDIIYDELCAGHIHDMAKEHYDRIVGNLRRAGAQGVILGCTELTLLAPKGGDGFPLFDTTKIHVEGALDVVFSSLSRD